MTRVSLRVLCLLAILAGLLAQYPAQAEEEFVRIQGNQFTYKGQIVRMKGSNYYPRDHMWASMWSDWDWSEMVTEATMIRSLGMNCVRILVPYSNGGWNGPNVTDDKLGQLENLVNMLGQNGIRSCITLFDWETSFPAAGTSTETNHITYLSRIVNRLKDNKYVFMWDVKNEPDHPSNIGGYDAWDNSPANRDKIVSWLNRMCDAIHARDTNHPVGCGIRWYQNVKDVISFSDIAIFHSYWRTIVNTEISTIKTVMGTNQKPILAQEFGWPSNPNPCYRDGRLIYDYNETEQLTFYTQELTAFEQQNIAGCIQWMTFDAKSYTTNQNESFENYFGLWRHDYSLKPAGEYYRDHFVTQPFPYTDVTPPATVWNFKAEPKDGSINLSWNNPSDPDFKSTLIRFSTSGHPMNITDGQLVVDKQGPTASMDSFSHTGLTNGVRYYYTAFTCDQSGNYSGPITTSAVPTIPPKVNLLTNGLIDSASSGVAASWTAYRVSDNNALQFSGDTGYFDSAPMAQSVTGIDSASLPSGTYSAGGIVQVVPNVTAGKTYMLVGYQDFYCGAWSSAGQRYLHNFGINVTGATTPGIANATGTIGGAKWMGAGFPFWNNSSGGAQSIGGFHRVTAAHTAQSGSISIWTGLTIATGASKDSQPVKFNTDSLYLYEFDNPIDYGTQLINPGFEQRLDMQNGQDVIPAGWTPAGGSVGQYSKWTVDAGAGMNSTYGARIFNRRGHVNAGFMQRISTLAGTAISFSVWAIGNNLDDNNTAYIGIDPTGGTDITSSSVVWQSVRSSAWTRLTINAVAQSTTATLYIKESTAGGNTGGYHTVTFDDASATWTPSDNIPPSNPTYASDLNGAVTGQWTGKNSPDFVFGGALDQGGSGIASYDVYWGTDPNASTVTATVTSPSYKPTLLSASGPYYLRLRTRDAAGNQSSDWTTVFTYKFDASAPSTPGSVTAASAYIVDGKVNVSWDASSDDESGVTEYLYAVGTTPGSADILDWTSAGNVTSKQVEGLVVQPGSICYLSVKARNGASTDSTAGSSSAVKGTASEAAIVAAKMRPDTQAVSLKARVVTAVFADRFYIQEQDRSCGIAVLSTSAPAPGAVVDVTGTLALTADQERCLSAAEVSSDSSILTVKPLSMSLATLGGAGIGFQPGVKQYVKNTLTEATGINNIGLLVRVYGKVTSVGTDVFYISDGCTFTDSTTGAAGVCVEKTAGLNVNTGDFVVVTGISSCIVKDGNVFRLVRLWNPSEGVRTIQQ